MKKVIPVLVVLAILGLMVMIAIPDFLKFQAKAKGGPAGDVYSSQTSLGDQGTMYSYSTPEENNWQASDARAMANNVDNDSGGESSSPAAAPAVRPRVIRYAEARVRSQSIDADIKKLETKAAELGGSLLASMEDNSTSLRRTARLTISVPAVGYNELIAFLRSGFSLERVATNSQDVTEDYIDVESRLNNFRLEERRLVDLLATATGKLEEVLSVERELARVREEIERMQGRLRYYDNRVEYYKVTVELIEEKEVKTVAPSWGDRAGERVRGVAVRAANVALDTLEVVVYVLAVILPLALVVLPPGIIIWRRLSRKKT